MKNIEETIFESLKNDLLDHVNKEIIGQTRQICEELTGEPPFLDALYELVDAAEESIRAELYPKPVKPVSHQSLHLKNRRGLHQCFNLQRNFYYRHMGQQSLSQCVWHGHQSGGRILKP